jgi:hypothetical protein
MTTTCRRYHCHDDSNGSNDDNGHVAAAGNDVGDPLQAEQVEKLGEVQR